MDRRKGTAQVDARDEHGSLAKNICVRRSSATCTRTQDGGGRSGWIQRKKLSMHKRRADSDPKQPDRLYTIRTAKQQRADLQERVRSDNTNEKVAGTRDSRRKKWDKHERVEKGS